MKQPQRPFSLSIATPSDLRSVSRLCRRAVGPRDYVLRVLERTIKDGGLYLAKSGTDVVGMTNFDEGIDGSGWLSMARTDPSWRRAGVALYLQREIAARARHKGITALRLWTLSTNRPSINAVGKGGFKQVCEAAHISYRLPKKSKRRNITLNQPSESELESFLRSKQIARMNGYFGYKWHFVKLSKRLLERLLRQRELHIVGGSAFILARPERTFRALETSLTLLAGNVTNSLRNAKEAARSLRAEAIGAYVPYNKHVLQVAKDLGFKRESWGRHCLVFEKTMR